MFSLQSETRGEQTSFIDEMIGNQKVVDAYSHAEQNMQKFDEINGRLKEYSLKAVFFSSITNPATRFVNSIVYAAVALFGAILAVKTQQQDFNLSVKSGQRVAIVGPTGCGKTTLINLLMRFYDPNSGSILIDGHDYNDVTRKSLRENFGMVLQDTWLKAGTIRDNLIMGAPDATDEEIIDAAKKAHSHSFIKRLPDGYDTIIGEDGGSLSQGQKQLLCITRLMLCKPPMLILDEATSSIDTRTEIRIQKAFNTLMQGRTTFIVAHRLATIKEADIILVMNNGNIIEQGTHNELLAKKGFYFNLYNSQFVTDNN